ncbi:MAG: class I SAM-dependent methyltransferase [Defluviicoccus sp.]
MVNPRSCLPPLPATVNAGRVWLWPAMVAQRPCPACAADEAEAVCRRPDGLFVVRCRACSMLYVANPPTPEALAAFYADYAAEKNLQVGKVPRRSRLLQTAANPYLRILKASGGVRGFAICEIGCSHGDFLDELRRCGAEVFGVEKDLRALAALKQRGIAAAADFPQHRRFDAICAFELIEHLEDPADLVRRIAESVADDGRLLLGLPNGGDAERVGPGWIGYRVDLEHLSFFSIGTLSTLLNRFGLYVEHYWESGQPMVDRPTATDQPSLAGRIIKRLQSLVGIEPSLAQGCYRLTVLARKAGPHPPR